MAILSVLGISEKGIYKLWMPKSISHRNQKVLLDLLRKIRLEAGLTQDEVAERLKRPQSFVSDYETGERRLDLIQLQEVCKVLGVSLKQFVRRFEDNCIS